MIVTSNLLLLLLLLFIVCIYLLQLGQVVAHVKPSTVIFVCAQQKRIESCDVEIRIANVEDGRRSAKKLKLLKM